ncbi:solute carrier family 35 member G1-like [Saccoglossus kowalevskii]|uniref:Solute carrier family 35 member G2-like n=1 Tax=Saccoglossus kowalevskii TaxID=10224 RepID=A0ABM0M7S1_SACKO|nr:PREDICTED: solute carrier family 35 member G2-like [Saccoglossus kowalevskii]
MSDRDVLRLFNNEGDENGNWKCCTNCQWSNGLLKSVFGVSLSLLTGISFAVSNLFIALGVLYGLPPLQLTFLCNMVLVVSVIPPIIYTRATLIPENPADTVFLVSLGVARTFASIAIIYSLVYIPIGNVTAISGGTIPIFSALGATIFLGEPWKIADIVASAINVAGTLLITRPTFLFGEDTQFATYEGDADYYKQISTSQIVVGYSLVVGSSVGYSTVYILIRILGERVSIFTKLFYADFTATSMTLIIMFAFGRPIWEMDSSVAWYMVGMAIFDVSGQWSRFGSLELERTAVVTLLSNIEVVTAYILQYFFMQLRPTSLDITGAVLVVLGSIVISSEALYDSWKTEKESRSNRNHDDYH